MKNKYLFLFATILLLSSCQVFKQKTVRHQMKYIPQEFSNTYLGMPMEDFLKARNLKAEQGDSMMGFRLSFTETINKGDIKEVIYYLDNEGEKPLYEYIIEYKKGVDVVSLAREKYGEPNWGTQWQFDSKEGFPIRIWTYAEKNRLIIAGGIKGTEWDNE